jgi:hypothetical protein
MTKDGCGHLPAANGGFSYNRRQFHDARCAMAPILGSSTEPARRPLRIWFIASGLGAVLFGIISVFLVHAPIWVTFVLLPTSATSFDPSPLNLTQEILKGLFVFGGSFLIYGTAGWLLGNAIQDLRE